MPARSKGWNMKKIIAVASILGVTWGLAACGSTSTVTEKPTPVAQTPPKAPKADSLTTQMMKIVWAQQSAENIETLCAGWAIDQDFVYENFAEGAGPETMAELSEKDVRSFITKACA